MPPLTRNALIASSVVLLHGAALWAFQNGLLRRAVEVVVPVQLLEASLETPQKIEQPSRPLPTLPPPPKRPAPPTPRAVVHKAPATPPPAPRPVAIPDPARSPSAVTSSLDPQPAAAPTSASAVVAAPATAAAPAPAPAAVSKVELPVSDADYLHNPPPKWPRLSERLGEHGRVLVRVLIGSDGRPKTAQVKQGSGYERLDQASVEAVMSWRFVPGKRGGVPEEMWVIVPIRWGD